MTTNETQPQIAENFESLPEERRSELAVWFFGRKLSTAQACKRCRDEWGIVLTSRQIKEFRPQAKRLWNQIQNLDRLKSGAAKARVFQKVITDHPAEVFDLLLRAAGQASFDRVIECGDKEAIRQAHDHLRLLLSRRKDDRDEKRYKLTREKWEFAASEACLKQLPELKLISDRPELSFKEKLRQIRLKLFGSAP